MEREQEQEQEHGQKQEQQQKQKQDPVAAWPPARPADQPNLKKNITEIDVVEPSTESIDCEGPKQSGRP